MGTIDEEQFMDDLRPGVRELERLVLNPRGVRKARREGRSYDGRPTLHVPGCRALARTDRGKWEEVPISTVDLLDRTRVWYCTLCVVRKADDA